MTGDYKRRGWRISDFPSQCVLQPLVNIFDLPSFEVWREHIYNFSSSRSALCRIYNCCLARRANPEHKPMSNSAVAATDIDDMMNLLLFEASLHHEGEMMSFVEFLWREAPVAAM
mmetsp:Transcript_12636/g.25856  ORF Transcript_12636/g.25856 Transcript_12636/m.25856 type:complete len:115 (+) Transcript_12636:469-813(+)